MGFGIDSIRRDFARHKKKAGILGVLTIVMAVFICKAFWEMNPQSAAASSGSAAPHEPANAMEAGLTAETPEQRGQARELWTVLHEKNERGLTPEEAFAFRPDAGGEYMLDPSRRARADAPVVKPVIVTPPAPVTSGEAQLETRRARVQQAAQVLLVSSTVVGAGIGKPMAIINGHLLGVGDHIEGFEITAIRGGEIDVQMDGITLTVGMAIRNHAQ